MSTDIKELVKRFQVLWVWHGEHQNGDSGTWSLYLDGTLVGYIAMTERGLFKARINGSWLSSSLREPLVPFDTLADAKRAAQKKATE